MKNAAIRSLLFARACRDFGDGFIAVLLPLYLIRLGYSPFEIGALAGSALFGSALLTLTIGVIGNRYDPRHLLILAALLMAVTGVALFLAHSYLLLLAIAFIGSVNPSGGSAASFVPVEHAVLAGEAASENRTNAFAIYSLVGGLASTGGAFAAALPDVLTRIGWSEFLGLRSMFAIYAILGLVSAIFYASAPLRRRSSGGNHPAALGPSRSIVYRLAALFSLDAFAGGLTAQSLLALWLFERFDLSLTTASVFFFWSGVLAAFSFPVAAWLAKRFGLINTMVFTHIPASFCLLLAAFTPSLPLVLLLLLARAALSQMDVPTRSSYVMAVVTEEERTAAASFTSVPRSLAASLGPLLTGALFSFSWTASPLILCGALKIAYDLLLLDQFRHLKPPEEL